MRDSRQITVLRSLFNTLHPLLETGLRPAKRLLTGLQDTVPDPDNPSTKESRTVNPSGAATADPKTTASTNVTAIPGPNPQGAARTRPTPAPLERTLTDEHLLTELENVTRQYDLPDRPREPRRSRRHYSRDTLLSLLEEAKVRIQVLETELELARGTDENIPLLTEEWSDDLPSTHARRPD